MKLKIGMRLFIYTLSAVVIFLCVSLFCEAGYYYLLFKHVCPGWPNSENGQYNLTRVMLLADMHIMGPVKSFKIDKLRREWQMEQAFKISTSILKPDLVVFMGDLLDEATFSRDKTFQEACNDFDRIFPVINEKKRIIIAGNHDVGFHDLMIKFPYLMERFQDRYLSTPNVALLKYNDLNFVMINSMSFYNDTCPFCSHSIVQLDKVATYLSHEQAMNPDISSAPILLTHIPLFRHDDTTCDKFFSNQELLNKKNIEGEDVVHKTASQYILDKLKPRLVLSGHTHMSCITLHSYLKGNTVQEITLSSFNHKYAENRPDFLLLTANRTHVFTQPCYLVKEWFIATLYSMAIVICFCILAVAKKKT